MERQEGNTVLNGNCENFEEVYVYVNCKDGDRYCGKCCFETEMPLTEEDIKRIERLGYRRECFSVDDGNISRLKNVNGKCYFLDEKNMCKIYEYRPEGCRLYPAVLDGEKVVVDKICPKWREVKVNDYAKRRLLELIRKIYGL